MADAVAEKIMTTTVEKKVLDDGRKHINQFEVVKNLGKGAFGKVKLVQDTKDGKFYALKIMDKMVLKKKRQGMTNMLENVQKEIAIMKKINHPNCVHMYEVIDDPNNNKLYIRLEFVEGGQCMEAANGTPPLSVDLAKNYFIDLISGLEYIHFNHILHRDLKPENLLVTKDGILKLADFGVSSPLENEDNDLMNKTAGTPAFMAPECCTAGAFHGKLADVWAAGVSLYFMVHGKCPFISNNIMKLYEMIQNDPITYDESLPADLLDLLKHILERDPSKRYTLEDCKQHPWVKSGKAAPEVPSGVPITVTSDEISSAFTLTDSVVLMVKINLKMKSKLAQVRRNIAARKAVGTVTNGVEEMKLPDGFQEAADSDNEVDAGNASPGTPSGKKKGRCSQQ